MHAADVISTLHQRGITLRVVNGGLKVRGVEKLSDREKATLKRHKTAILKTLAASLDYPITLGYRTAVRTSCAVTRVLRP